MIGLADVRPDMSRPAVVALGVCTGLAAGILVVLAGPLPLLVLVGAVLALAGSILAPGVVFAAYLLIAFYKGAVNDYSPVDITVFLALANTIQIVPVILRARRRHTSQVGVALWIAMGMIVLAGVLYAPDQQLALGKAVTYWSLVVLPILPAALRVGAEPRYVTQFVWCFYLMGLVTVGLGLIQLSASDRLVVLGQNTIQVGRASLLVPLIGIAYVLPQRRTLPGFVTVVTVVAIPVAFIVAIASGSRGPLVVFGIIALAAALRYFVRPGARRWRALTAGAGIIVLSLAVISIAGPRLPALSLARFASLVDFIEGGADTAIPSGETSAAARVRLFQYAADLVAERPIIGAGTGGFEALSPRALGAGADAYPHNAVLQIASEYGLMGLVVFLGLIAVGLVRQLPGRYTAPTVRLLFIFFLLNAMVSGDILTDRETLGLLLLVLSIEAPLVVMAKAAQGAAAHGPSELIADPRPASSPMPPWTEPRPWRIGEPRLDQPGAQTWV